VHIPALTGVYIAFLLLGQTKYLPYICDRVDFRTNVRRILLFAAIYAVAFEIMRLVFPIPAMALPFKAAVIILGLKYIYKIKWKDALYSFIIMFIFLVASEPLVMSQALNILKVSLNSMIKEGTYYLILGSWVVRIVAIIVIASLWNLKIVRDDITKRRKLTRKRFIQLMVLLFFIISLEMVFTDNVLTTFCTLSTAKKIISTLCCLSIGYINYMIYVVYLNILNNTVESLNKVKEEGGKNEKDDKQ